MRKVHDPCFWMMDHMTTLNLYVTTGASVVQLCISLKYKLWPYPRKVVENIIPQSLHFRYLLIFINVANYRIKLIPKCGHMTHHSKAGIMDITHLCISRDISIYFGHSLFQRLCRWSCDLFQTKLESSGFWICHRRSLVHSNSVSPVASRCVWDKRQHETSSWKKLSNHPFVRVTAVKFLMASFV